MRTAGKSTSEADSVPEERGAPQPARMSSFAQFGIPLAAFAAVTGVAELAGAANLGTAMGIGQIAFAIALTVVLLRG
jgi:hypothetical protein